MSLTRTAERTLRALKRRWIGNDQYKMALTAKGGRIELRLTRPGGLRRTLSLRARSSDAEVARQVFGDLQYSLAWLPHAATLRARYDAILAAGETPLIIDAGANVGLAAIYFRDLFPDARIVAVEPDPGNFAELTRHCGGDDGILCVEGAVASREGRLSLSGSEDWAFRTAWAEADSPAPGGVRAYTIPGLIALSGSTPFLLKMDIEGAEQEVFSVDAGWIDRFDLVIAELHDWLLPGQANSRNFLDTVAARDRDFLFRHENVFSIANRRVD